MFALRLAGEEGGTLQAALVALPDIEKQPFPGTHTERVHISRTKCPEKRPKGGGVWVHETREVSDPGCGKGMVKLWQEEQGTVTHITTDKKARKLRV